MRLVRMISVDRVMVGVVRMAVPGAVVFLQVIVIRVIVVRMIVVLRRMFLRGVFVRSVFVVWLAELRRLFLARTLDNGALHAFAVTAPA
jgi:hypothetical protein